MARIVGRSRFHEQPPNPTPKQIESRSHRAESALVRHQHVTDASRIGTYMRPAMKGPNDLTVGHRLVAAHDAGHELEEPLLGSHRPRSLVPAKPFA